MNEPLPTLREEVVAIVKIIPEGRLMTYGQIAALAGHPKLPWQRVVNKKGYLANGYPGGRVGHQQALASEGIEAIDFRVPIERLIWWPSKS